MANTIRIRRKTTTGVSPIANRAVGEMEVNHVDKTLTYKKDASTDFTIDFKTIAEAFASPTFTGNPTAPTQDSADDSTKLATTAFVQAVISGLGTGSGDMTTTVYDQAGKEEQVLTVGDILDEDDFVSDSEEKVASQQSTKAFIIAKFNDLINAAPGTLDTLNEIAAALGDDPNFAATITAQLAQKLDANSTIDGGEIS